ncbi:hypothetical protein U1E44_06405 [Arenibacter sp. GZD96]|uniref:hypothetical protein n=1 Tax=Aurantibrevibacter litoralis TaxID=3106030 RepID=UPI002AFFF2A9|nr:hypothetical protein [Arenibacter sp. GZD-96]MEA1785714.1 hypothetical protein [Arenibacter sp. GZD-96]
MSQQPIDLPDEICLSAVMPEGTSYKSQFLFTIKHIVNHPNIEFYSWFLSAQIAEKRSFNAKLTTKPTANDFERYKDYFEDGFGIVTSVGQFIIRDMDVDDFTRKNNENLGYTTGWRITVKLVECLMEPFDQHKFFAAIPIYQSILQALIIEYPPKRAIIYRQQIGNLYLGPFPPHAEPEAMVAYTDKMYIEETYASLDAFCDQWDKVSFHNQNGVLAERDLHIISESDYKISILKRGMGLLRVAKASVLGGSRGIYRIAPTPYDEQKLAQLPSYIEQIGYNENEKSLEYTAYVPEDAFFSPKDIFLLMDYAENGTADGKEVKTVIITFPTKAMAEKEALVLRYLDYVKIQYLAGNGSWAILS